MANKMKSLLGTHSSITIRPLTQCFTHICCDPAKRRRNGHFRTWIGHLVNLAETRWSKLRVPPNPSDVKAFVSMSYIRKKLEQKFFGDQNMILCKLLTVNYLVKNDRYSKFSSTTLKCDPLFRNVSSCVTSLAICLPRIHVIASRGV